MHRPGYLRAHGVLAGWGAARYIWRVTSRGTVPEPEQRRIRAALAARAAADAEVKAAVIESSGSVRELARLTGLSTNTISRWKRGD